MTGLARTPPPRPAGRYSGRNRLVSVHTLEGERRTPIYDDNYNQTPSACRRTPYGSNPCECDPALWPTLILMACRGVGAVVRTVVVPYVIIL